jgi:antibiotic biosynthesis monooxygenase (ABM) superfamily enzyme
MGEPIHVAVTRRVKKSHIAEFERALAEFASQSLAEPGARGVHCLHPPPGSESMEYGIMRSFASNADRDTFYQTPLYREWLVRIEPMVEGEATYRQLEGLEAWFRNPHGPMPPRWKMALLTWIAVWPVSMLVPAILMPLVGPNSPQVSTPGLIAAGIVVILTWVAMPLLVKVAHPWLHPMKESAK